MADQTEKPNIARPASDDAIDVEYRELMKLAGQMGASAVFLGVRGMKTSADMFSFPKPIFFSSAKNRDPLLPPLVCDFDHVFANKAA